MPVTRISSEDGFDLDNDQVSYDEIEYPKNLKDLSWDERQELHDKFVRKTATANSSDLSPSHVIDTDSEEYKRVMATRRARRSQGAGSGTIVPAEDPSVLIVRGVDPEDVEKYTFKGRVVGEAEAYQVELASLPKPERDAEERFGSL